LALALASSQLSLRHTFPSGMSFFLSTFPLFFSNAGSPSRPISVPYYGENRYQLWQPLEAPQTARVIAPISSVFFFLSFSIPFVLRRPRERYCERYMVIPFPVLFSLDSYSHLLLLEEALTRVGGVTRIERIPQPQSIFPVSPLFRQLLSLLRSFVGSRYVPRLFRLNFPICNLGPSTCPTELCESRSGL